MVTSLIGAALLVAGGAATSAGQDDGSIGLTVSADRTDLDTASREPLRYTVVATSAHDARFAVRVITPEVRSRTAGLTHVEGSALVAMPDLAFSATPGSAVEPSSVLSKEPGCAPNLPPHGDVAGETAFTVSLAAGGQATIQLSFRGLDRPLWPGVDYRVDVRAEPLPDGHGLALAVARTGPQVHMHGPHGRRISLSSRPRGGVIPVRRARVIPVGQRIALRGRTYPPLRRRRLSVRESDARRPSFARVGTVRTSRRATFRYRRWAPRHAGIHLITVFSPSVGSQTRRDYSCPLVFDARRRRRRTLAGTLTRAARRPRRACARSRCPRASR